MNHIKKEVIKEEVVLNKQSYLNQECDMVPVNKEHKLEELPVFIHRETSSYKEDARHIFDNQGVRDWTILDVLIRNSLTQKREGLFMCNFCKQEFIDSNLLRAHMETYFEGFLEKDKPAMIKIKGELPVNCIDQYDELQIG